MKQKNYKVDGEKQINWIIAFIRKYLKLEEKDNLFVYVNQAFSPSPDQTVQNLTNCFGADGKLVLYYSRSQAWG
jgi:ubiquitin-like protein ATG12